MSRFLDDEYIVYHKFQKVFNSLDIYLRRDCVTFFMLHLGEGNIALRYFNNENTSLSCGTTNTDHNNATTITLNSTFFSMKYDKRFQDFMNKVIEKYSV